MSRKRDIHISESDLLLWQEVTASVKKLATKKPKTKITPIAKKAVVGPRERPNVVAPKVAPRHLSLGDFGHLSNKTLKQMARGEMSIDAKLDLHGFTELQAFDKLVQFVQGSFADSHRLLLVVTGKGSEAKPSVLKGKMELWVNTEKIAPFVLRFAHAAKRHGGEGAFYLYLRKAKNPLT